MQAADAREALDRLRSLTREGPSGGAHVAHEIEVQQLHARLAGALSEAELTRQKARLPEMTRDCPRLPEISLEAELARRQAEQEVSAAKVEAQLRVSRADSSLKIAEEKLAQLAAQHGERSLHLEQSRRLSEQADAPLRRRCRDPVSTNPCPLTTGGWLAGGGLKGGGGRGAGAAAARGARQQRAGTRCQGGGS